MDFQSGLKQLAAIILPIFLWGIPATAQDWSTATTDTLWFSAGQQPAYKGYYGHLSPDTNAIRSLLITNKYPIGNDTAYEFEKIYRDTSSSFYFGNCIDTLSPSWTGHRMIRKSNGTEFYFNSFGDTIKFQTQATLGSSWNLAVSRSGIIYVSTVSQTGIVLIDGTADSFKTISIQAYSGSVPVADWYNNKVFQFTKNHGWTKTLDMYRFPNALASNSYWGITIDSNQHLRLPASISHTDLSQEDIAWKYSPGNEWIRQDFWQGLSVPYQGIQYDTKSITYDSIISTTSTAPNTIVVMMKSAYFIEKVTRSTPLFFDTAYTLVHLDTISTISKYPVYLNTLKYGSKNIHAREFQTRYFIDTFAANRYIFKYRQLNVGEQVSGSPSSCVYLGANLSGPTTTNYDLLLGFGSTMYDFYQADGVPNSVSAWKHTDYLYFHTGTIFRGIKFNVAALSVPGQEDPLNFCHISPNPVSSDLNIQLKQGINNATIILRNTYGQTITQKMLNGSRLQIKTSEYPSGMYFLQISAQEKSQSFKVYVHH